MAKTTTDSMTLEFAFTPLVITSGIEVVGNVPAIQQYDIATGFYTPDYSQIFLMLRPWANISDPDGVLTAAEKVCVNFEWTLIENKTETAISTGTDYTVNADGTLTVKRNVNPDYPAAFRCDRDFLDTRTGEVYHLTDIFTVRSESVSRVPQLELDAPVAIMYDSVRDTVSTRKVKATLRIGDFEVPAANREFVWQKKDEEDTSFHDIDGTDIMDYDVNLNESGDELTIDCAYIGNRIDIRVYAKYNPLGSPANVPIDTTTPVAEFSVNRHDGKLWTMVLGSRKFPGSTKYIRPECSVLDSKGIIPNPDAVTDTAWYVSKNNANGTVSKGGVVATGTKPTIPTTNVAKRYGAQLIAEAKRKEPLKAARIGDDIMTINGEVILIR